MSESTYHPVYLASSLEFDALLSALNSDQIRIRYHFDKLPARVRIKLS